MCNGRGKPLKEEWDRKNPNEPFPISETVKQQEAATVSGMTSNDNTPTKKKAKKVTTSTSSQSDPTLSIPGTSRSQSNLNIPN